MATSYNESDFARLSWHDCHIWGLELRLGEPDEDDWTSDLALDIDFIVEWLCGVGGGHQFRVAPAWLVFHAVTDLSIDMNWGDSGFQVPLHEAYVDRIEREPLREAKVYLDRPYYNWRIKLNCPESGEIAFGAVGFSQTLRAEPVLTDHQRLSFRERTRLINR